MSSSKSESNQSNGSVQLPLNLLALKAKIFSVKHGADEVQDQIAHLYQFQQAIADHKNEHEQQTKKIREKMSEMNRALKTTGQNQQKACDERLAELFETAEPYLHSGTAAGAVPGDVLERCIGVLASAKGIEATIQKTSDMSAKVLNDHYLLARLEAKQRDAIERYEEVLRVQGLAHGVPADEPLFHVANLPALLFTLSISADVAPYYQKTLKELEKRLSQLVAQIRLDIAEEAIEKTAAEAATFSSMSNGEVGVGSLQDHQEYPVEPASS
ncbi:unnamed protein product [Caenorhabditis sp. 36 PRJEB53466]|nr:unnamed protein product [Caenorhabditis sp. 36 PRJEB53466]